MSDQVFHPCIKYILLFIVHEHEGSFVKQEPKSIHLFWQIFMLDTSWTKKSSQQLSSHDLSVYQSNGL